jgi:hypothetical protein
MLPANSRWMEISALILLQQCHFLGITRQLPSSYPLFPARMHLHPSLFHTNITLLSLLVMSSLLSPSWPLLAREMNLLYPSLQISRTLPSLLARSQVYLQHLSRIPMSLLHPRLLHKNKMLTVQSVVPATLPALFRAIPFLGIGRYIFPHLTWDVGQHLMT